jgi:cholesterol transport system auxiliary component
MRADAIAIVLLVCSGCSLMAPKDPAKADFDFGPVAARPSYASQHSTADIVVHEVIAPAWMDNSSMYYRLAYQNAANPMPYAQSEWVMSPAALLTQRLRVRLSESTVTEVRRVSVEAPPAYTLRSELFEFEQVFDQRDRSRGVLRLRATLQGQGVLAQRSFVIEKPAPTADAAGGVAALSQCVDELASSISEWIALGQPRTQEATQSAMPSERLRPVGMH